MNHLFRMPLLLAAMALTGCASDFVHAPPPPEGDALVYVYRGDGASGPDIPVHVYVDGKAVFDLPPHTYAHLYLAKGEHILSMSFLDGDEPGKRPRTGITAEAGQNLFVTCGEFVGAASSMDVMLVDSIWVTSSHDARAYFARTNAHPLANQPP